MATTNWSQKSGMSSTTEADNLESYVDQSAASQTAAAASEANAATSEVNAATSEANAGASATASSNSATAAASSETAAGVSQAGASSSESAAGASETNAAASATSASTSAAAAATSETNAATSETNAATSASAAEASKDAALAALDSFDDRYLGQKATDPTVDNDGDALISGALYFNTTDDIMKVYDGSLWVAAYASLSGAMLQANNLSDLVDAATARSNLGLGTASTTSSADYATAAQGALADTATQPSDLGTAAATDSTAYATAAQGALADTATQPSDLGTAATTAASDYATAAQGVKADASVQATATTGQANLPSGTTAQRTSGPIAGAMRFNSTDMSFEGYNGTEWGSIGGGAADGIFYENEQSVTANYTIAASKNAMTTGPITINSGVSVTIETGARWVVL